MTKHSFPKPGNLPPVFDASVNPSPEPAPPTTSERFDKASEDTMKVELSEPALTLTPDGTSNQKGGTRQTVAEKSIDASKLPDTRPMKEQPRKKQFNHSVGRHRAQAKKNEKNNGPDKSR